MTCVICKHGETRPGKTTITLERDGMTIVFKAVPADICTNCGEQYVTEMITGHLLETANQAAKAGIQVDIREYKAA